MNEQSHNPEDQSQVVYQNITNLYSHDKALKINSIRQLNKIVEILGEARTISELFPYLQKILEEGETVLLEFCKILPTISTSTSNPSLTRSRNI